MMRDEHLNQLLRELPRYKASDGLAEAVERDIRARATERSATHHRSNRIAGMLVTAAVTLSVAGGTLFLTQQIRERERIDALQSQHRALAAEISALRAAVDFEPVIDLGEDDGVRYVLDLRPIEEQPSPILLTNLQ